MDQSGVGQCNGIIQTGVLDSNQLLLPGNEIFACCHKSSAPESLHWALLRFLVCFCSVPNNLVHVGNSTSVGPKTTNSLSQVVFCLPRPLYPGVVPSMISFSKHSPSFRMICPKYAIFLLFTDFSKSVSTPAVSITQMFVFRAVHNTLSTCRKLFISNDAFSQFSSSVFNVQLSHPYIAIPAIPKPSRRESLL